VITTESSQPSSLTNARGGHFVSGLVVLALLKEMENAAMMCNCYPSGTASGISRTLPKEKHSTWVIV